MTIIYTAFVCLTLLVAVMAYTSGANRVVKAAAIVSLVVVGLGLEGHYRASLGKPIENYPPDGFVYVHHEVQGEDIAIWAWLEKSGNKLYLIPFDQETAEELAEAQEKGTPQQGTFTNKQDGKRNDSDSGLIFDDWIGDYTGETKGG